MMPSDIIYCVLTMIWHHAGHCKPQIPAADRYGWKQEGSQFVLIITSVKPAFEAVGQIVGSRICKTGNCSCRRVGIVCTGMFCEGVKDSCTDTERDTVNMNEDKDEEDTSL